MRRAVGVWCLNSSPAGPVRQRAAVLVCRSEGGKRSWQPLRGHSDERTHAEFTSLECTRENNRGRRERERAEPEQPVWEARYRDERARPIRSGRLLICGAASF